jgi:hypothetical protein
MELAKNTSVIPQVNRPFGEISLPVSKARISYVEVTSFKLIPFSAFWAKWRRVACQYYRHSVITAVVRPREVV